MATSMSPKASRICTAPTKRFVPGVGTSIVPITNIRRETPIRLEIPIPSWAENIQANPQAMIPIRKRTPKNDSRNCITHHHKLRSRHAALPQSVRAEAVRGQERRRCASVDHGHGTRPAGEWRNGPPRFQGRRSRELEARRGASEVAHLWKRCKRNTRGAGAPDAGEASDRQAAGQFGSELRNCAGIVREQLQVTSGVRSPKLLKGLVGLPGFEPGTSCTPSKRASQAAPQPEFSLFYRTQAASA